MICCWSELLRIVPPKIRSEVNQIGKEDMQELRMRCGQVPELVLSNRSEFLRSDLSPDDLIYSINMASRYSPWVAATSSDGYITAPGGHRLGLCGEGINRGGLLCGIRNISSLCIRVARDFPEMESRIPAYEESILILGAPGWGKTTLLRSVCRRISQRNKLCVVDERGELFPVGFSRGRKMDVLTGCTKPEGIQMVLRTMGPDYIAVDEITDPGDAEALRQASYCGVKLLATAHASSLLDLRQRPVYRHLLEAHIFSRVILLHSDKSFSPEGFLI